MQKRVKYSPETMAAAIQSVRSGAMSRKAAVKPTLLTIPETTLLDKL